MKLKDCLEIGQSCELETVGESIFNIELHRNNLFGYDEIPPELNELYGEYDKYNCKKDDLITDKLNDLSKH